MSSILLVGYPNVGKSSLFNILTGLQQKTANFPGVTVDKKIGSISSPYSTLNIVDLPGIVTTRPLSIDEQVTLDYLSQQEGGTIVFVANISHLDRQLPLLLSLMDLNSPFILFLNMADEAFRYQCKVSKKKLAERLGIPVIIGSSIQGKGINELKKLLFTPSSWTRSPRQLWTLNSYEPSLLTTLSTYNSSHPLPLSRYEFLTPPSSLSTHIQPLMQSFLEKNDLTSSSLDSLIRSSVMTSCSQILDNIYSINYRHQQGLTSFIESLLLHPIFGVLIFIFIMSIVFYTLFTFSEIPMKMIDSFFSFFSSYISSSLPSSWLKSLIINGVIPGLNGVFIFLPQILIIHFFIGLLQDTGYMARVSYLTDGLFSKIGLSGKSFFPLFSAHACAIPGVMATRNIENYKERLLCILITPLMSCPARLPVYSLMISLICPENSHFLQTLLLLIMYFLPILVAIPIAILFKKLFLPSSNSFFFMELPPYRWPVFQNLFIRLMSRSIFFLKKAGTLIFFLSLALYFFMSFPKTNGETKIQNSYAGRLGRLIEPAIRPLGYDWRVGIGLIGSFSAREVFVSTMGVVFNVEDPDNEDGVFQSFKQAKRPSGFPLFNPLMCLSLMTFFAFSMQCLSTVGVVIRETNSLYWSLFQLLYMNLIAYLLSLTIYQLGRFLFPSLLFIS